MDIRRHVGDYALFTSGLFRTWVERQGLGGYYLEQGRRAYGAAAELAQLGFVSQARLFGALEEQFEHLSGGLDYVCKVYMRPELHGGAHGAADASVGHLVAQADAADQGAGGEVASDLQPQEVEAGLGHRAGVAAAVPS